MRARDVIGRTIVAVHQERVYSEGHPVAINVVLELDNGDRLVPVVGELDCDYAVDFVVNKTERHTKRKRRKRLDLL